jgi:hypothetical protein
VDLLPIVIATLPVYLDTWEQLDLGKEGVIALKNAEKVGEKCSLDVLEQLFASLQSGVLLLEEFNEVSQVFHLLLCLTSLLNL